MQATDSPHRNEQPRHIRSFPTVLAGIAAVLIVASTLGAPTASAAENQPTVEGVWRVTRHGVNCQTGAQLSSFPAIMAFNKDGIVTGYGVPPSSSPALGSPEYGTWQRSQGHGAYAFHLLSNNYDGGMFSGTTEIVADLRLDNQANTFSYRASVQFFDINGNPLFSVCGAATATRFQ